MMNEKELQEWLKSLAGDDSAYKMWYTLRKKAIQEQMSIGLEQKDYWKFVGRLEELKHLNQTATDLLKQENKELTKKKYASRKKSKK